MVRALLAVNYIVYFIECIAVRLIGSYVLSRTWSLDRLFHVQGCSSANTTNIIVHVLQLHTSQYKLTTSFLI